MPTALLLLVSLGVTLGIMHHPVLGMPPITDPCMRYGRLNDESRSVFKTTPSSYTRDDTLNGWYRFMGPAGDRMLDYVPKYGDYRCNARFPGYLDGQHPSRSEGTVSRTVCFVYQTNTCYQSQTIQVKNCGEYFVYKLHPLTSSNYLRYCGSGEVVDNLANPCQGYLELSDASRSALNTAGPIKNDNSINGWYRFTRSAGDRLAENEPNWARGVYRCSSRAHGWLNDIHPNASEGKVYREVCFTYNGRKCWRKNRIKVKNCGNFYVYLLHGFAHGLYGEYQRYCSVGMAADTLSNPCQGYKTLSDASRSARFTDGLITNDNSINGWYRFIGDAGDRLAEYEVKWTSGVYRCASRAHGWLNGEYPSPSDGKVYREVCFAYSGNKCWRRNRIKMKNCGSFSVYLLNGMSHYTEGDYLRYCGVGKSADTLANPCQGYKTLSDASRSARNTAGSTTNDNNIDGWYRFTGDAGDRLAEYELKWTNGVYRCASRAHGWLNGKYPSTSDDKVYREVCFAYNGNKCWQRTRIKVKNCGSFFVYLLNGMSYYVDSNNLRYCGVGETGDTLANPCQGYRTLSDASRSARNTAGPTTNDNSINGWYRFTGDAGDRLAEYEVKWTNGVYRCASRAHGWLNGDYPSPSDDKVSREVCFTYNGTKCWQRTKIKMKNCGNFSVYLLNGMSYYKNGYFLRYCGVGETTDTLASPCQGYKTLSDASRSARNTAGPLKNDNSINGWYRFTGDAGDRLAEYEVKWTNGVYRCSSRAHGWLNGEFPNPSDGKVDREVCFTYDGRKCWQRTRIKVRNCGNFSVYLFNGMSYYVHSDYLRYCSVGETVDTLSNPCEGYRTLSDASRSARNTSGPVTNDNSIYGWYRFMGDAGDRLAEYELRWADGDYRCSSRAHGWLNGEYPSQSDGKVYREVCFTYNGSKCWQRTRIKMKNCGSFSVYLLNGMSYYKYADYLRYCGVGETVDSLANPCQGYRTLSDESRSILVNHQSFTNDQAITGWYRFSGKAGSSIVDYDPQWQSGLYRCKSAAHGWMTGSHPRGSEGKVNRTVCFSYKGDTCWHSTKIKIRNCGDFYVYLLNGLSYYQYGNYLRYCGAGQSANNKPCKHFQLLTEETRIASYQRKVNKYCDRDMNGWYRFWGEAGNRMLEKCPVVDDKKVFPCGAYYHGWLNATNPVPLDGTVDRTVCFTDITTCNCKKSISKTIQMRNCGNYFVYKLYNLNNICSRDLANNARYCGMRDKDAYRVTCSANYMRIDLDRRYYNSSKYKSITLMSPTCKHTLSYDYITLGCIPGRCESEKKETTTEIIYVNAVKLTRNFGSGQISRENDETIRFRCSYKKDAVLNNKASFDPVGKISVSLQQFGNFSFFFNTYKTNAFKDPVSNFPVKLKLRDWLYFEVNATVQDSSLTLLIERCYSTPTMNPNEPLQYDLVNKRCSVDVTTSFIPATGLKRRFSMQVFRYENTTTVYIHCLVFLCRKNSTDSRCESGCSGNNVNSRKRRSPTDSGIAEYTGFYKLDSGNILLDEPDSPPRKKNDGSDASIPTTTLIFGGMGGLVLILIILVIILVLRRRTPAPSGKNHNKEIGMANIGNDASDYPTMKEKSSIVA